MLGSLPPYRTGCRQFERQVARSASASAWRNRPGAIPARAPVRLNHRAAPRLSASNEANCMAPAGRNGVITWPSEVRQTVYRAAVDRWKAADSGTVSISRSWLLPRRSSARLRRRRVSPTALRSLAPRCDRAALDLSGPHPGFPCRRIRGSDLGIGEQHAWRRLVLPCRRSGVGRHRRRRPIAGFSCSPRPALLEDKAGSTTSTG